MKNFAKRVSALVLALVVGAAALCPAALAAASLPDLPKDECVVDDANILSDSTTQTIVDLNNQLQSSCNGAQIGVLTVDYTGNYSTEDYATQAFNAWDIGSASENNGVLILLVMESPIYEDGDYYVTYGDGFRNTTLESQASALAQTMEGDFVNRDYSDAVITCANNVAGTIADIYGVSLSGGSYNDKGYIIQVSSASKRSRRKWMSFWNRLSSTSVTTPILLVSMILSLGAMTVIPLSG